MDNNNNVWQKLSVLVIENSPRKRSRIVDILHNIGFKKFDQSGDGVAAFRTLKRRPVDLIIANMDLPQMNGMSLLKVACADEELCTIPFILVTENIDKEMVIEAGKWGVASVLLEPLQENIMRERLGSILSAEDAAQKVETEDLFSTAQILAEKGNHNDALGLYKKILDKYEDAEVYYNIGYIKTSQKKFDEAIIAFRKAVMINNFHAKAFKMMGSVYMKKGDPEEAQKCLEKAGEIFMERNMDKEAEESFNELIKIKPDTVNVYNSLGILYRKQHNFTKAVAQYRRALKVDSDDENIYFNLGRALLEDKDIPGAKKAFEDALVIKPDFKEAKRMIQAIEVGFKK